MEINTFLLAIIALVKMGEAYAFYHFFLRGRSRQ